MQKAVGVIGVTGFVGKYLAATLAKKGYQVVGFSRQGKANVRGVSEWRKTEEMSLHGLHAIINLAGERVDQRWTTENKQKFESSRIGMTKKIAQQLEAMPSETRPQVWINASAVGFYGDGKELLLDETSPSGEGYLAKLCIDWEKAVTSVSGVRPVIVRIGMVLGRGGMAWDRMKKIFALGLGGKLGSGQQWMPWIHVQDLADGIVFSLENEHVVGVVNGVSPSPERNLALTKKLASTLHRPAIFGAPGWALRLAFGDFGDFLLGGQRVYPRAWEKAGFVFTYPTLELALVELRQ